MKVLLILVDGMRPDSLKNIPEAEEIMKKSLYTLKASTVFPSVTLPCHVSLFHSVDPARHGTTTNIYAPQVRAIKGLCEVLSQGGRNCSFFHNWNELRDLARPGSLDFAYYINGGRLGYEYANAKITDEAIDYLKNNDCAFTFLYLGHTDCVGHNSGWMSEEYLQAVKLSFENIKRIADTLSDDYTVIVTADHGGHDRVHGTDLPEDMTIPLLIFGNGITPGEGLGGANIKDIAPTVTHLLGLNPDPEWEGKNLL